MIYGMHYKAVSLNIFFLRKRQGVGVSLPAILKRRKIKINSEL